MRKLKSERSNHNNKKSGKAPTKATPRKPKHITKLREKQQKSKKKDTKKHKKAKKLLTKNAKKCGKLRAKKGKDRTKKQRRTSPAALTHNPPKTLPDGGLGAAGEDCPQQDMEIHTIAIEP